MRPIAAALALCLAAALSPGGQAPSSGERAAPVAPANEESALGPAAADAMVDVAVMDLRLQASPGADDFLILSQVLESAQAMNPDDVELARQRAEAAFRLGDDDALREATRDIVRLDPADSTAVLRLITMRLAEYQTSDARMEAYRRYLGSRGASIDPAVRSRLALDAALLARETGDESLFVRLLTIATQLDATHKEAAVVAATYYAQRVGEDPAGRLELLINVLRADPLDPNVHLAIARLLASHAVAQQAARFHACGRVIFEREALQQSDPLNRERLALEWLQHGPEAPLRELNQLLARARHDAETQITLARGRGLPTTGMSAPEEVRLGESYERMRVLAAHAAGDEQSLDASLRDLSSTIGRLQRLALTPTELPMGATVEDVQRELLRLTLLQIFLHAWTGHRMDELIEELGAAAIARGQQADRHLAAWLKAYEGDPRGAEQDFLDLAGAELTAWVGVARAREMLGDLDGAVDAYSRLAQAAPLTSQGLWARARAQRLGGGDVLASTAAPELERLARDVPVWIDRAVREPSTFVTLDIDWPDPRLAPATTPRLRVLIRNLAPQALAVGEDRTIQSRVMIAPSMQVGSANHTRALPSEVVLLERRLRLAPREQIEATIPLRGFGAWYSQMTGWASQQLRARVIQDFRHVRGQMLPGPFGLRDESRIAVRPPLRAAAQGPETLMQRLREAPPAQLPDAAVSLRAILLFPEAWPSDSAQRREVVEAASDRYRNSGEVVRAYLLAALPHTRLAPDMAAFDATARDLADDEQSPHVLRLLLLTRVTTPEDPLLDLQQVRDDPTLRRLARAVRARLQAEGVGYAGARSLQELATRRRDPGD